MSDSCRDGEGGCWQDQDEMKQPREIYTGQSTDSPVEEFRNKLERATSTAIEEAFYNAESRGYEAARQNYINTIDEQDKTIDELNRRVTQLVERNMWQAEQLDKTADMLVEFHQRSLNPIYITAPRPDLTKPGMVVVADERFVYAEGFGGREVVKVEQFHDGSVRVVIN